MFQSDKELRLACRTLQEAAHSAAKNSAKGIGGIARHYGFNAATFQNKLNPTQPGCINLRELTAILYETGSAEIIDTILRIAGRLPREDDAETI